MMNFQTTWPEPVVRVQSLSEGGVKVIPSPYVKPLKDRAIIQINVTKDITNQNSLDIPVIDLSNLASLDETLRAKTLEHVSNACREWGFFQVVNHGVSHDVMARAREAWREFFKLPMDVKQDYANFPDTYEGYGSRLGVEENANLDWSDYYFLHYAPVSARNLSKWPSRPSSCREVIEEYGSEVTKLCGKLLEILSINLGLEDKYLKNVFGGEDNIGCTLRACFYPKCPQPDLTLGLSPHSDPGALTILLPDDTVQGLQIRRADDWVTVTLIPDAFIVNIADQLQMVSNGIYKSVEHRVIVNSIKDRISLAFFCNPKGDVTIEPAKELVNEEQPAQYKPTTFDEYRLFIRKKGLHGKKQVESFKST